MTKQNTLQQDVDTLLEWLAGQKDGFSTTTSMLARYVLGRKLSEDELLDLNSALFLKASEYGLELDNSHHAWKFEGLPYNLDFYVRKLQKPTDESADMAANAKTSAGASSSFAEPSAAKASDYEATKEELEKAAELGGYELYVQEDSDPEGASPDGAPEGPAPANLSLEDRVSPTDVKRLLSEMAQAAFSPGKDDFAVFVSGNRDRIRKAAEVSDEVGQMLVIGYKMGISAGSAACMNDLGALYYMGDIIEQDYAKAAELYEMAMDHGCDQSIINLGYIWEYGRTGERDYQKAYRYYALAAALTDSSEAAYKLGDMYSRGKAMERDVAKAYRLWSRSLDLAGNVVEAAQPSIRIAQLLMSDDCEKAHVEPDTFRALVLFQQAEIGLRIDIAAGQTYYRKRLQEAIEGQAKARAMLDEKLILD